MAARPSQRRALPLRHAKRAGGMHPGRRETARTRTRALALAPSPTYAHTLDYACTDLAAEAFRLARLTVRLEPNALQCSAAGRVRHWRAWSHVRTDDSCSGLSTSHATRYTVGCHLRAVGGGPVPFIRRVGVGRTRSGTAALGRPCAVAAAANGWAAVSAGRTRTQSTRRRRRACRYTIHSNR
jgi:hypothetical protein